MRKTDLPPAVKQPCNDCPWRRDAVSGWLGPLSAAEWVRLVGSDEPIACHQTIVRDGDWEGALQCAGAASYRANTCKMPRDPDVVVGPRRDDVFNNSMEFMEHHDLTK